MHANLLPSGFALNNFSRAELPAAAAATQQLGDARKQKMMMIRCMTFNVLARKHTHHNWRFHHAGEDQPEDTAQTRKRYEKCLFWTVSIRWRLNTIAAHFLEAKDYQKL